MEGLADTAQARLWGSARRYGSKAGWQQPEVATPELVNGSNDNAIEDALFPLLIKPTAPASTVAEIGVTIDGAPMPFGNSSEKGYWTTGKTPAVPTFNQNQTQPDQYIEIFARAPGEIPFTIPLRRG